MAREQAPQSPATDSDRRACLPLQQGRYHCTCIRGASGPPAAAGRLQYTQGSVQGRGRLGPQQAGGPPPRRFSRPPPRRPGETGRTGRRPAPQTPCQIHWERQAACLRPALARRPATGRARARFPCLPGPGRRCVARGSRTGAMESAHTPALMCRPTITISADFGAAQVSDSDPAAAAAGDAVSDRIGLTGRPGPPGRVGPGGGSDVRTDVSPGACARRRGPAADPSPSRARRARSGYAERRI